MQLRAPVFWYESDRWWIWFLFPLSWFYRLGGWAARLFKKTWLAPVPVVCVGNAEMGGVGKTPMVMMLVHLLQSQGYHPHIVSRGYGGSYKKSCSVWRVQPHDSATCVGDEALLLVQCAPTWVTTDRRLGIQRAVAAGANCIVLDDGFQNPSVVKNCQILLVDGHRLWGNGHVFPAGPLREPYHKALQRADTVVVIGFPSCLEGQSKQSMLHDLVKNYDKPIFIAHKKMTIPSDIGHRPCVAFAGIGNPKQFFDQLRHLGVKVVHTEAFPDHHPWADDDERRLLKLQAKYHAVLVTTQKDFVRLSNDLKAKTLYVDLNIQMSEQQDFLNFVLDHFKE